MIRIAKPGGGHITKKMIFLEYTSSDSYTGRSYPSIRLTTRQNVQFQKRIKKKNGRHCVKGVIYIMNHNIFHNHQPNRYVEIIHQIDTVIRIYLWDWVDTFLRILT
jgi:sulfite reductase beta subunit-like hemoprotein